MKNTLLLILLCLAPVDDWSKASAAFKRAMAGTDQEELQAAVADVAKDDSERAARILLGGLATPNPKAYWVVINGLSMLKAKDAVDCVTDAIVAKRDPADRRRDLLMALQLNSTPAGTEGLLRVAKDGDPQVQVTAIDELASRGHVDAIPVLIELLKTSEAELKRRALKALITLTGIDNGQTSAAWKTWWESSGEAWKREREKGRAEGGRAGQTVVEAIRAGRKTEVEDLTKGGKTDIVVVEGVYDQVQAVLDALKIPHTLIKTAALTTFDLSKTRTLLINCGAALDKEMFKVDAPPPTAEPALSKAAIARVREFVGRGGYLFTSDWGLTEVLEPAFPGYCKRAGVINQATVDIYPRKGSTGHPYLKEVFVKKKVDGGEGMTSTKSEERIAFKWVIDGGTFTIDYDPGTVTCLVEAPDLEDRKHPAVAVTFAFGERKRDPKAVATGGAYEDQAKMAGGRVLHVLSHFGVQETAHGEYAIQNMLLNFLIEARERQLARKK